MITLCCHIISGAYHNIHCAINQGSSRKCHSEWRRFSVVLSCCKIKIYTSFHSMQYTLWNKSMYAVHSLEQVYVCSTLSGTSLCMQYTLWNKSMHAVHSLEQLHVCSTLSGTSLCMQYTLWNKSMYPNNQLHREMFIFCQSVSLSQVRLCKSFVLDNGLFHVIKQI